MKLTVSQQLSTNRLLHTARVNVPAEDPSGFWETTRVALGRGYCSHTHAHTRRLNGVYVHQVYYMPGPSDLDGDGTPALPASTYSVYCGVEGMADNAFEDSAACIAAISAANPAVDREALGFGKLSVWSPDGEGSLYAEFDDDNVEAALAFADSLSDFVEDALEVAPNVAL